MSESYTSNIDHDHYARVGRQLQAQEAKKLFLSLVSQFKKIFVTKDRKPVAGVFAGHKC